MKDEKKRNAQKDKKPYLKPKVQQAPLRPEETVLGGCKVSGSSNGPATMGSCNPLGLPCNALGTS